MNCFHAAWIRITSTWYRSGQLVHGRVPKRASQGRMITALAADVITGSITAA